MPKPGFDRERMPEAMQALCFLAGANSIFLGDKLLATGNPSLRNPAWLDRAVRVNQCGRTIAA